VAEIRLRHLNREYILRRTNEVDELKGQIADLEDILQNPKRVLSIIVAELKNIVKKYAQPRKTLLYYPTEQDTAIVEEEVPDYPVNLFFTKEGYFKKITPQSLRMSGEQKLKEGDALARELTAQNNHQLLFFTDRCQVYKADVADFADTKASVLGDFIPVKLGFDEGENAVYMAVTNDFSGFMLFFFQNGKAAKVQLSAYQTKTKRKKLLAAYSGSSPLVAMFQAAEDGEYLLRATNNRTLIANTGALSVKTTKITAGVAVITLRKNILLESVIPYTEGVIGNPHRFRTKTLPAAGSFPREEDMGEQLML